jgi:hypothetical protein
MQRLKVVYQNAVKHGFVTNPYEYPDCGYRSSLESFKQDLAHHIESQIVD